MAAIKVLSHAVSLLELKERCPKSALKKFQQLVKKRDHYISRLQKLEESGAHGHLPPIDWDFYKRNVRSDAVSLVEDFEKKYTSLTVPYPVDNYTSKLEKLKEQVRNEIMEFVDQSNCRIEHYQREIERIKNLLPFNQMSWEEFIDAYPREAPDFINNPTFWPHDPTEQLGYVDEEEMGDVTHVTGEAKKRFQGDERKAEPNGSEEPKKE